MSSVSSTSLPVVSVCLHTADIVAKQKWNKFFNLAAFKIEIDDTNTGVNYQVISERWSLPHEDF